MRGKSSHRFGVAGALAAVLLVAGCGDLGRQGTAPVQLVINALAAAPGGEDEAGGTLNSDVITRVDPADPDSCTLLNDVGEVTLSLVLNDPGRPGVTAAPSALNQVTITGYRVDYQRADGRNTPGVDVPYGFDSGVTFTVPATGEADGGFTIVRHTAKLEAPLLALRNSAVLISTIARVTFYGADQAGNPVSVTGSIGITFGDFGASC